MTKEHNFPDTLVIRNAQIRIDICRKDTNTNKFIPVDYIHWNQHPISAINLRY